MEDDTGRPGRPGDEPHNPWAPPRDGVAPGRGSMEHNEEDLKRRSVAEQPTVTSGPGAAPPPVPPAPGGPPGGQGPGGGAGSPYGASPYGAPSPYGQQGHQQYGGGAAYGYPAPGPQPFGYGMGQGPGGPVWPGPPPSNGKSVAAMVIGIIGLVAVSTCWGSFLGIILCPIALGLGLSAKRAADRGELGGRGQAVAGFVMGIVGTVLAALCVTFLLVMLIFYSE